jgi:hypothetical protein
MSSHVLKFISDSAQARALLDGMFDDLPPLSGLGSFVDG